jgi:hypothetical protein
VEVLEEGMCREGEEVRKYFWNEKGGFDGE